MSDDRAVNLRDGIGADAERLTRLAHDSKRYWGYDEADIARWAPDLTVTPAFIDRHVVRVALAVDSPIAFYALSIDGAQAEIEHFWVNPDSIGYGIGAELFADAVEQARRAGASSIRIVSDPNAQGFYEKMGAELVGEAPSTLVGRVLPILAFSLEQS